MKKWLIILIYLMAVSLPLWAETVKYKDKPNESRPFQSLEEETKYKIQRENTVIGIAKEYHKSHTYSKHDLFVCTDMAIDIWNQLKTQSVRAKIGLGNLDKPGAELYEANHVWVMAEIFPHTWMVVETTSGQAGDITEVNRNYFYGFYFSTPVKIKKCRESMANYTKQLNRVKRMQPNDSQYATEVEYLYNLATEIPKTYEPLDYPREPRITYIAAYFMKWFENRFIRRKYSSSEYSEPLFFPK